MTLYDDYRNTDYLDDVSFIAGSDYSLYFPVYDADTKLLLPINASSAKWVLGLYGYPEGSPSILQKTASIYDANTFLISLSSSDTLSLGGDVYLQQIEITDSSGNKTRPAQGIVIIRKAIPIT